MAICDSFQVQMASVMDVLTKTAVAEIAKLVEDGTAALRLEICRSQTENDALKGKLLQMESELRAVRGGHAEGTTDNSLNISFEVQVCDEFREAHKPKFAGKGTVVAVENVFAERLSTGPLSGDHSIPVEKKHAAADALVVKYEPVDGEQDWSESQLLSRDRLEEDPKRSQSKMEQKIREENTCGTVGTAANGSEGPLCEEKHLPAQACHPGDPEKGLQAELKQEPEGEPVTPGHPLPRSVNKGVQLQFVWSKANSSGMVWEKHGQRDEGSENRDTQLGEDFPSLHYRASQRLCSENGEVPVPHLGQQQNGCPLGEESSCGLPDDTPAEMAFPLGSLGEASDSSVGKKSQIQGQQEFICVLCGKTFLDALELKAHRKQHGTKEQFSCSECRKCFASSSILEKHLQIHSRKERFSCSECGRCFASSSSLGQHQRIHSKKERFSCSECGNRFLSSRVLEKHQLIHRKQERFSCSECGKSFSQLHMLKVHEHSHAGQKPHVCMECGKCFRQKNYLKIHQRVHTGEKPFACTQCGRRFHQIRYLNNHLIAHAVEKPLNCTVCNKTFASLIVLLEHHQSVHAGEKCLICKLCGKQFESSDSLERHRLARHREKSFTCTLCGKGFTTKGNLKSHQIIHTGEKPHRCNDCGRTFAYLCNLKTHQRVHTGEKRFNCMQCGWGASQKRFLQKHILWTCPYTKSGASAGNI